MAAKKLMLLGGIRYLLPVIRTAHEMGIKVITVDYLPENIAHAYSDDYVNASILDKEAVLSAAREKKIDGILSFGVDPGVVIAAYVAGQMGLPSPPLHSVEILQDKGRFRSFLRENAFNCPFYKDYSSKVVALGQLHPEDGVPYPLIVKPVDSAGSKGVSRVNHYRELASAIDYALSESHSGRFIVEQFLEKVGSSSDTDSFSIDGKLVFCSFNCQFFDSEAANPYTPSAFYWPSDMPDSVQNELRNELQRLICLLHLGTAIYNIETRLASDGKAYIMECSPRGGGNRLAEILKMATGQDLIANAIRMALGLPLQPMTMPSYDGTWAEAVLHSNRPGAFQGLRLDQTFESDHVIQKDLWIRPGDRVAAFSGANQTLGTLVLKFSSTEEAKYHLSHLSDFVKIDVDSGVPPESDGVYL